MGGCLLATRFNPPVCQERVSANFCDRRLNFVAENETENLIKSKLTDIEELAPTHFEAAQCLWAELPVFQERVGATFCDRRLTFNADNETILTNCKKMTLSDIEESGPDPFLMRCSACGLSCPSLRRE